jgi:phage shock protein PspC (stress-responsive transcriptional regulator)
VVGVLGFFGEKGLNGGGGRLGWAPTSFRLVVVYFNLVFSSVYHSTLCYLLSAYLLPPFT